MSHENKPELIINGKRTDGRDFEELRPLKIEAGILKNAGGSAYLEWGNNKVLAAVYGPREVVPKHLTDSSKAIIKCRYSMAPFSSLSEHGRSGPNRRATEISKVIREVFENVIMLNEYPGSEIDIFIEILQGDGGTRTAGITAAAVALASAGIAIRDLVYAVSAAKIGENLVIDPNMLEDNYSDADMPVAVSPKNNEILLLQMDGGYTKEELKSSFEMIFKAGKKITDIQKESIRKLYESVSK